MPKNKISDLRNHLFAALEGLTDTESPLDLDRARAICEVSQTIINAGKLEVEMVKAISNSALDPSAFFENRDKLIEEGEEEQMKRAGKALRFPLLERAK